jgi:hypothetical protein
MEEVEADVQKLFLWWWILEKGKSLKGWAHGTKFSLLMELYYDAGNLRLLNDHQISTLIYYVNVNIKMKKILQDY